ncbi:MAG TPA: hypothetical protein VFA04_27800 [Bryobacteraceae bacterium]|nr:hypothetical protein [Bryobacteraceae bacterium]
MNPVLAGLAILVVEDELLAALDLSFMLRALGGTVIGPAGTLEKAQALVRANVLSGAILDVKLVHTTSLPLAEELLDAGVPVILATGYESDMLPERFSHLPRLVKPYSAAMVGEIAARQFRQPQQPAS